MSLVFWLSRDAQHHYKSNDGVKVSAAAQVDFPWAKASGSARETELRNPRTSQRDRRSCSSMRLVVSIGLRSRDMNENSMQSGLHVNKDYDGGRKNSFAKL